VSTIGQRKRTSQVHSNSRIPETQDGFRSTNARQQAQKTRKDKGQGKKQTVILYLRYEKTIYMEDIRTDWSKGILYIFSTRVSGLLKEGLYFVESWFRRRKERDNRFEQVSHTAQEVRSLPSLCCWILLRKTGNASLSPRRHAVRTLFC
jgi:hypothetical protein